MTEKYDFPPRPRKYEYEAEKDVWITDCVSLMRKHGTPEPEISHFIDEELKKFKSERDAEKRRGNKDFTQVYKDGWQRLQILMKDNPSAARLYAFFAENMGPDGTLGASRATLAEALEITERTITRHVKYLEERGAIFVLKVGSANVYCLKPEEVWKSFDNAKTYAPFHTRTLVGKGENPYVKKRLAIILGGKAPVQSDMFDSIPSEEDNDTEALGIAAE